MQRFRDSAEYVLALCEHEATLERLRQLMLDAGPPYSGNYVFCEPERPDEPLTYSKQVNLWNIARLPGVTRVLEIGFNAGHSAAICLMAKPDLTVLAFDIAEHAYTPACARFVAEEAFPGRLRLLVGDSQHTVPAYAAAAAAAGETFDLVHVDGCHTYEHALADLRNTLPLCHADTVVLVDDYHGGIQRAVEELVDEGLLRPHPGIALHPMPAWPHAVFQAVVVRAASQT